MVHQVRKGLYVTRLDELPKRSRRKPPLYVVNAFTGTMRNSYHAKKAVVNYMILEWDSSALTWKDFRGEVVGDSDPAKALPGSIRHSIFMDWEKLGLPGKPTPLYNCVWASSSAFEALRARLIWMKGGLCCSPISSDREFSRPGFPPALSRRSSRRRPYRMDRVGRGRK